MSSERMFESGFIHAFINEFYIDYFYKLEKEHRLFYILYDAESDRKKFHYDQVETSKKRIMELGFEDLSYSYILSAKNIGSSKAEGDKFVFWINRFAETFKEYTTYEDLVYEIVLFSEDVFKQILLDIEDYETTEYWEIDLEYYKQYIFDSKAIKLLFDLCELLALLNKLERFNEFTNEENQSQILNNNIRVVASHHALCFILECLASGSTLPRGEKNKLQTIGDDRIGKGKGNRFYKAFNEIVNRDLDDEVVLIEIAGENWKDLILSLSKNREQLESYLKSKGL